MVIVFGSSEKRPRFSHGAIAEIAIDGTSLQILKFSVIKAAQLT
jgi:hypothetical protein